MAQAQWLRGVWNPGNRAVKESTRWVHLVPGGKVEPMATGLGGIKAEAGSSPTALGSSAHLACFPEENPRLTEEVT